MSRDTGRSKLFHKLQAVSHYFLHGSLGWRFAVYAQQRFCSGLPEENPTIVLQKDFHTIQCADSLNAPAGESGWRICLQSVDNALAGFDWNVEIEIGRASCRERV